MFATILTPELRARMDAALREDIENNTRTSTGSCGYLNDLENTADGTDLSRSELLDVVEYFGLEE